METLAITSSIPLPNALITHLFAFPILLLVAEFSLLPALTQKEVESRFNVLNSEGSA